jgi:hypothetical protein
VLQRMHLRICRVWETTPIFIIDFFALSPEGACL